MTANASHPPFLSVIVPTFLRPAKLACCIDALTRQSYPRDRFEVIVVDDGSGAPPTELIQRARSQLAISLVEAPHGGPALARNIGAAHAKGSALVFTDDDCRPERDWLTVLAALHAEDPHVGFGGRVMNELGDNRYSEASQALVSYVYAYYAGAPEWFFCTDNLTLPTDGFHALGGFAVGSVGLTGEDRDLCERWLADGRRLRYAPDAVVRHAHALTLRTFLRQHWRYGKDAVDVYRNRRRRTGRMPRPRLRFYAGLLGWPSRVGGAPTFGTAALLALSQVAYGAGVLNRLARERMVLMGRSARARDTLRFD